MQAVHFKLWRVTVHTTSSSSKGQAKFLNMYHLVDSMKMAYDHVEFGRKSNVAFIVYLGE